MLNNWQKWRGLQIAHRWFHQRRWFENSVSYYEIFSLLSEKIFLYNIDQRAAAVAYHFTLAVFPTILFLFTLIPYIPIPNLDVEILSFLKTVMPQGFFGFAEHTIKDIVSHKKSGILSFGVILTLVTSTNGMSALMTAFNMADNTTDTRSYLKSKWIALLLTIVLSFVLIFAVIIVFIGGFVVEFLNDTVLRSNHFGVLLLNFFRYIVIFSSFLMATAVIYKFAPKRKHRWRWFNVGAWAASALIILATYGFSFYISKFDSYNKLYGSIGTIIALMYWFYLIALLLIFGFEINISISRAKRDIEEAEK